MNRLYITLTSRVLRQLVMNQLRRSSEKKTYDIFNIFFSRSV